MLVDEFLQRWSAPSHRPMFNAESLLAGNQRPAAVLIPLICRPTGLHVLFTQRAAHLRHHPGQISFPGGKHEATDEDLLTTALRETYEEIGLQCEAQKIIGKLPTIATLSGFCITPYVGLFQPSTYTLDSSEVAEVFELPLEHFLQDQQYLSILLNSKQQSREVYFIHCDNRWIWGASALMMKQIKQILTTTPVSLNL